MLATIALSSARSSSGETCSESITIRGGRRVKFSHDGATDHELHLGDGRRVTYSEFGDPDGAPVLSCHGGLLCRFDVEPGAASFRDLGARVISPDRPGVGGSDRKPGHSTVDWVDDAREVLDALGIERCAVMGWSLGGQYAAAVGARLGDRVSRVAIIAGAPPLDDHERFAQLNRLDRRLARLSLRAAPVARVAFTLSARVGRRSPLRLAKFEAKHSPAADAAVIRDHGEWLGLAMGEGGRNGAGMVDEYRAFVGAWGFDLAEIQVPTHIYQGLADTLVPPPWAKELAAGIAGAELTEYDDEGHMIAVSHRADVVRALVASP
jgi:pimeloyl-ACP methyl ester carboxylesterase